MQGIEPSIDLMFENVFFFLSKTFPSLKRFFEIQNQLKDDISKALSRREALLRLVDPICLGDFKWFVFSKFKNKKTKINSSCIR